MLTSIVGINWGDEGKGRMVDLLSQDYDIVIRYQGGNNAGHTVINHLGKFVLNLLPSGILNENVVNIMGPGMVIDLEHLSKEIENITNKGLKISPKNLKISNRAIICLPYHIKQDILEEERLKEKKYGSTKRGISPVYGDKYLKKCIRIGDLLDRETYKNELKNIIEWKNLILTKVYNSDKVDFDNTLNWLDKYASEFKEYICDTGIYINNAVKNGKKIIFEAQLGALRDIDYGIYPYTSSSSTISAYAPIGAGVPNLKITNSIGIMKAYSTCVGEGPFVAEMFGEEAENLRKYGAEYGAATGRPRRVGPFDMPASRYGIRIQGCNEIALTKLDVLSYLDKIPICVAYNINGKTIKEFPYSTELKKAKPIIEYLDGWKCNINNCRKIEELPKKAVEYIKYIEKNVECKIKYVSVGASRNEYIIL